LRRLVEISTTDVQRIVSVVAGWNIICKNGREFTVTHEFLVTLFRDGEVILPLDEGPM
jgi:hypothetical protein